MSIELSLSSVLGELDSEELLALARIDLDQGRMDQALLKMKHILQADKGNSDALSMAGKVYAQLGLFDKAKNCFKQYLEINPESIVDKFQYGMVHFDSGDRGTALSIWNELLSEQPTHPPSLFYKGLLLAQNDNIADARATLSILLQSAPADNLYFGRAKELLQAIDKGGVIEASGEGNSSEAKALPKDAYKAIN